MDHPSSRLEPIPVGSAIPTGRNRRSIGFRLRLLVIVCVLPACAVAALLIARSYEHERDALQNSTIVTARALMQAVDLEFAAVEAALLTLATSRSLSDGNMAEFYFRARDMERTLSRGNIVLLAPTGQQIFNTLAPFGTPLPENGSPGKLPLVFSTGKPVISDLFLGPVRGNWLMGVEIPVFRDGEVVYGLAMSIFPDYFDRLLRRQKLPPDWFFVIVDSTGRIVARTHNPERFVGKLAVVRVRKRLAEVSEGVVDTDTHEGVDVFAAFSRSPTSGWAVIIGVPRAALTSDLRRSVLVSIGVAGGLLILGALLAGVIARRIAQSIRGLTAPALALASGEPLSFPHTDIDEVKEVQEALAQASHLLARRAEDRNKAQAAERQVAIAERATARFSAFLEAAPDAMMVVRPDATVTFMNRQAEAVFGYPKQELLGRSIEQLLPERFSAKHRDHLKSFFAIPKTRAMGADLALFGRRKDGSEFPVEVSLSPIEFDGEAVVMAAARDVTERKKLEANVATIRTQMVSSARLTALGTMAGGIAHEINNPLAVIHGLASDLAESAEEGGAAPAQVAKSSRRILDYAERITRIVKSLRTLARDGTTDAFDKAPVAEIVGRALDLLSERFRMQSVALRIPPIDPGLSILCREVQISQILTNLLQNALHAALEQPDEKWVRLDVVVKDDRVAFLVVDSGRGISPDLKARIMDPFFTTKPIGQGTGLGLSLSMQIAQVHGGTLEVAERDGHTCFTLTLPIAGRE